MVLWWGSRDNSANRRRVAQEALESSLDPQQLSELRAVQQAEQQQRKAAAAAQAERVAAALASDGPGECRRPGDGAPTLRLIIDCSFSPDAPPKELISDRSRNHSYGHIAAKITQMTSVLRSLCKQIENASSLNKRHPRPACLTLTSWGEPLAAVAAPSGAAGWRVVKRAEGPVEAFGAEAVVVLSPDASEPLLDLDPEHRVYVIGGIVDRTHRKGLTLKYAEAQRVTAVRLPISEHAVQLGLGKGTRKCPVLNIDDVVRALLIYQDTRGTRITGGQGGPLRSTRRHVPAPVPQQADGVGPGRVRLTSAAISTYFRMAGKATPTGHSATPIHLRILAEPPPPPPALAAPPPPPPPPPPLTPAITATTTTASNISRLAKTSVSRRLVPVPTSSNSSTPVPSECISTGLALQSACDDELELASKAFAGEGLRQQRHQPIHRSRVSRPAAKPPGFRPYSLLDAIVALSSPCSSNPPDYASTFK
ncbi:hypothetical protein VOLCADRAFT_96591 [Volvox carteri f. nagariensis]|uniref:tRNA (guanine(9)-N(1))-methyltransferase n=1 Tax=Volvox carteri f. nagariensis TaxID=3068 RepID=D8UAI2_VOLCA|nr:uncharacterized protein VOLCADRAFT_96591 [Volvox carteri f. nagariensis]EFJ43329.1 hypothetical protein VOLCADRAFT_96591 [Volvox carteri f. nagariensis]|eukprot:XP_002955689.1 hypothetical protein VOLCADRAFT_96591 [Volvox carteri f. nagariensis]